MTYNNDLRVLRPLAERVQQIAQLPEMAARRRAWTDHNALRQQRPLVMCFPEGAWLECIPPESLHCTEEPWRGWETRLRMAIWTYEQLGDDQVIDAVFNVPWDLRFGDFGEQAQVQIPDTAQRQRYYVHPYRHMWLDSHSKLGAYHVEPVLKSLDDLAKLHPQTVEVDRATSEQWLALAHEAFDGILEVRRRSNPWLVIGGPPAQAASLRGMDQLMFDLYDNPQGVHALMRFLADNHNHCLDWMERNGLLTLNNGCEWIGTGGLGYSDQLPAAGFVPDRVRCQDIWGGLEAQSLVGVSGEMYQEFFLPYIAPIMERFGLGHYGCCEGVQDWLGGLMQVKNLRRVSISAWADLRRCAELMEGRYVFCYKPTPTPLGLSSLDEASICTGLIESLRIMKEHGCVGELIMKDLHTVQHEPARMRRWVQLAREAVATVYGPPD